jgi:hypothetical protein
MSSLLLSILSGPLTAIILGPLVYFSVQGLKKVQVFEDAHPYVKRAAVLGASALLAAATSALPGVPALPCLADQSCDVSNITPEVIKVLGGAGIAFLLHFNKKLPSA